MLTVNNITLRFGERKLFDGISFNINNGDRIGLVGKNGAGKSTLLKVINGNQSLTSGSVQIPKDFSMGYLAQDIDFERGKTVREEAESAFEKLNNIHAEIDALTEEVSSREDYQSDEYIKLVERLSHLSESLGVLGEEKTEGKVERTLMGLGFKPEDLDRPTSEFSGGWRMRIELAKILLQPNDILLLDEPTNHLDLPSIIWFEKFLQGFPGGVVLVSHDRRFLDRVTNRTIELSNGKMFDFPVGYSKFEEKVEEIRAQQLATRENQLKQIAETEKFINRFRAKATKAKQVQSKMKQLEKVELIEVDERDTTKLNINIDHIPRSGKRVLTLDGIGKSYGDHLVLNHVDLFLDRGDKIALIGKNGEGKSTLNKIIAGEEPYEGKLEIGHNVSMGYFAQDFYEHMNPNQTVLQYAEEKADPDFLPKVRDFLGAFGFSGEDTDKKVKVLSGGERGRLGLCALLMQPLNLLVLDEPTNHLDLASKDLLKEALKTYSGSMILVSHDRDFLDGLVDKYYEVRDTKVSDYIGELDDYVKSINEELLENSGGGTATVKKASSEKNQYTEKKNLQKDIRKLKTELRRLEEAIDKLEGEQQDLNNRLMDPEIFKSNEGQQVLQKVDRVKNEIAEKTNRWTTKGQRLEELESELDAMS